MGTITLLAQDCIFTPSPLRGTPPKFFFAKFRGRVPYAFGNIAVPLFFAGKEGNENCQCNSEGVRL